MKSAEAGNVDRQKVINDVILVTRDTIYTLQVWLGFLEKWQEFGQAEPAEFIEACCQLKEAELWPWARQAGGHGLETLVEAIRIQEGLLEQVHLR